jgi:3-deoxy-D-manno-octulosonic-acid transferase
MRAIYSAIAILTTPLALPLFSWRTRRQTGARDAWRERLGFVPSFPDEPVIWVHGASLGEINAAAPLVNTLITRHPAHSLLITSFTGAGCARARAVFGARATVACLPCDTPAEVRRFLRRARPRLGLIVETELWPNLYANAERAGVPLLLLSATVSERSFRRYLRFKTIVADTLGCTARIAAQSKADAERFKALGAPPERVSVTGNLKFDLTLPADLEERARMVRSQLFPHASVWTAGSVREGEEAEVVKAFEALRAKEQECTLVLAPRHPERTAAIAELLRGRALSFRRRTQRRLAIEPGQILLLDTMGELTLFYGAADVTFVGGSLVPIGGHNLLEPAAFGRPVIAGPHLENVTPIAAKLTEAGALTVVRGAAALAETVGYFLQDELARERAGRAGRAVVEANRGALDRVLALIEEQLAARPGRLSS